ncbi:hypothetical protein CNMCM5793_001851 [Aspergillus hiratsukae]|uniref:Cytochrome P450 n=1 Tax=Aspergillus hiratsukae TaxID=1194566 RepID=A0A8H6UHA0_9EURO|nr:hypothetical protein CNMCM5793_001851 [Aspergillus hiratsukae]
MSIATLPILGAKMYVIWDTALIQAGLRARTMSFDAIMLQHAQGLLGLQDRSVGIARDGLLADLMNVTKPLLAGGALTKINLSVLNHAAETLNKILSEGGDAFDITDLYDWIQTLGTLATTEALYGAANPMHANRRLVDDVWSFESGLRTLGLNLFPRVIAGRAYSARERLLDAISPLFSESSDRLPELTRRRAEVIRSSGIQDPREIARIELALLHGATVNTIPTLFWTVTHVFARPELVARLRTEILPLVSFLPLTNKGGKGEKQAQVSLRDLDTACPLLLSTYREVVRLSNQAMSTRHVMENTFITDSGGREYLLRAGSTVVMPATAHMEGDVWGINKNDFDPERFLDWENQKASKDRRLVYMPFGGGRHLCPGRNLAKAEILGFIVMLILSFDMEDGANLEQPIRVLTLEPARLGQGVGKPVYLRTGDKLPVRLRIRKGLESVNWRFLA